MASLGGTSLLWRGTALDRMWVLNPRAYEELAPFGKSVGIPFLLLSITLAIAGMGWIKRHLWAWRLTAVIITAQVLGDLINCVRGNLLRGGIGFFIASALLLYLLQPKIRATFT